MKKLAIALGVLAAYSVALLITLYAVTGTARASEGYQAVAAAAARHGVPVRLALGVARTESHGNCRARSSHGALGVMQVMPRTGASLGFGRAALLTCHGGATAGVLYLKQALRAAGGDHAQAARMYNAGIYAKRFGRGTHRYAHLVMAR